MTNCRATILVACDSMPYSAEKHVSTLMNGTMRAAQPAVEIIAQSVPRRTARFCRSVHNRRQAQAILVVIAVQIYVSTTFILF